VFARFEEEIRREYAWVEVATYAAGRAAALRRFVDRAFIYGTALFRERYESKARENIAWSLATLAGRL
jgi:predicted metal-dependent HD superfamily phosphohydrolase